MFNISFIETIKSLEPTEITVSDLSEDITVSANKIYMMDGTVSTPKYQCNVIVNGEDIGLIALYDADGNLLNFNDENITVDWVDCPFAKK